VNGRSSFVAAPRLDWPGIALVGLAVLSAVAVGVLAVAHPAYAGAVVAGAIVLLVAAARAEFVPVFLVATLYEESLSLGSGLRIGRVMAVFALAVVAYQALARRRPTLKMGPLVAVAGAYGIWTFVSFYWASDDALVMKTSLQYVLAAAYLLAFATLVRSLQHVRAVLATLALGALVFGIASFVSYAVSGHAIAEQGGASGLQGDHVYFAVYQLISLPAALALAATERRSAWRNAYYLIVAVIVLSVVASLARTGFIALGVVVLATLVAPWRLFFASSGQKVLYVLALASAAMIAALAGSATFVSRAVSIVNFGGPNGDRGSGRTDLWHAALHGYRDHPWFGLGAGNFQARSLDLLQSTPGVNTAASYVHAGRVVHNSYLEALTELGPVGLALLLLLIGFTATYLLRCFRRGRAQGDQVLEAFSSALLVSLLGFCVSAFFASVELSKPLWILAGLALALERLSMRDRPAGSPA
jgi:putative inorganic carbon (HCO3(-)) transporter